MRLRTAQDCLKACGASSRLHGEVCTATMLATATVKELRCVLKILEVNLG